MAKKLYVGNLSFVVSEGKLKELFSQFGEITEVVLVTDRATGRLRGFGFVTFAEDAAAEKAIAEMNGKEVEGRTIKVNEARPKRE